MFVCCNNVVIKEEEANLFGALVATTTDIVGADGRSDDFVIVVVENTILDDVMDQVDGSSHVAENCVAILPRRSAVGMPQASLHKHTTNAKKKRVKFHRNSLFQDYLFISLFSSGIRLHF